MSTPDKAELFPTVVYKLNGITYLPHYRNSSIYVGPGYPHKSAERYTEQDLLRVGATKEVEMLLSRAQHGVVDATHP